MKTNRKCDLFLRILLRFVVAVLPILAGFAVANLIFVLKYAGLIGFMCYFFPSILQLSSIRMCRKKFGAIARSAERQFSEDEGEKDCSGKTEKEKKALLPLKDLSWKEEQGLYMTPYSIRFISHPVCVSIVGGVGLALFCVTFSSLFIHPEKQACEFEYPMT